MAVLNTFSTRATKTTASKASSNLGIFGVDVWTSLDRFLLLGTESGSYYAKAVTLTEKNAKRVLEAIKLDGLRVVNRVVEISTEGRAVKNDPALFVLMLASAHGDTETRQAAYAVLPRVARTGTHLLHAAQYREQFGGWGRGARKAFARWFTEKPPVALALQVVKYPQRDGWSLRDVARIAHPLPQDSETSAILRYVTHGLTASDKAVVRAGSAAPAWSRNWQGNDDAFVAQLPELIVAAEAVKTAATPQEVAKYISTYRLPREAVPSQFLGADNKANRVVWEALLADMPMTAMIRNLANMTRVGILEQGSDAASKIVAELKNEDKLRAARVHPLTILSALKTYASGHGFRGGNSWTPVRAVSDALDEAFYLAFKNVKPTNRNIGLFLDASGSMSIEVAGLNMSALEVSAAMAMVTVATEPNVRTCYFSGGWGANVACAEFDLTKKKRLDDVLRTMQKLNWGSTDCSAPFRWAAMTAAESHSSKPLDAFIVYTDSETNSNRVKPSVALAEYRKAYSPEAKSVVVGLVANDISIADPNDAGMLDIAGGDSNLPGLLAEFFRSEAALPANVPVINPSQPETPRDFVRRKVTGKR